MIVKCYNATLQLVGVIDNYISLLWTRKFYAPGSFELAVPMSEFHQTILSRGNIVCHDSAVEAGVIESVVYDETPTSNTIKVSGRFLSSYMDRRLVQGVYSFSGLTETAMRTILSNATTIPLVQQGETQGFDDTVDFQVTYKNLLEVEEKLGRGAGIGFRFTPDFTAKTITFDLYKGTDRSTDQTTNARVYFSEEYDNINKSTYSVNDQLYKSVAYVMGEDISTIEVVGSETGLACREVFVDASDIQSSEMTADEYTAALQERGSSALESAQISESFESETAMDGNFVYRTDFDLGDIVTVRKEEWGISVNLRITEIQEIYEDGEMKISPVFGNPLPDTITWEE